MNKNKVMLIECGGTLAGILLIMFTPRPAKGVFVFATLAWLVSTTIIQYQEQDLDLKIFWGSGFWQNCRVLLPLVLPLCLTIFLFGQVLGGAKLTLANKLNGLVYYYGFALTQEFLLQVHFFSRLSQIFGSRKATHLCAGLFMFCHLPNPLLMAVTWTGAYPLLWVYQRNKNLPSVGLAQWLVGASLAGFLPLWLTAHNRVGLGFFAFYGYGYSQIWEKLFG